MLIDQLQKSTSGGEEHLVMVASALPLITKLAIFGPMITLKALLGNLWLLHTHTLPLPPPTNS